MNEKYVIKFSGEINKNINRDNAQMSLAKLLRINNSKIKHLFDGKTRVLKNNLDWEKACKYNNALKKTGVIPKLEVIMNAESLNDSIVNINEFHNEDSNIFNIKKDFKKSHASKSEKKKHTLLEISGKLGFDKARISPILFYPSHKEPLYNDKGNVGGYICSLKPTLNVVTAFVIIISISVIMGKELLFINLRYISELFPNTSTIGIIFAFFCYLSLIYLVIVLLFPTRSLKLSRTKDGDDVIFYLKHSNKYNLLHKYYSVTDNKGNFLSSIHKTIQAQHYVCKNKMGSQIFTAKEEPNIDELILDTAKNIRDELVDLDFLEFLNIIPFKRKKNKVKKTFIIRDSKSSVVGFFALAPFCVLTLYNDKINDDDQKILHAFSILLSGF